MFLYSSVSMHNGTDDSSKLKFVKLGNYNWSPQEGEKWCKTFVNAIGTKYSMFLSVEIYPIIYFCYFHIFSLFITFVSEYILQYLYINQTNKFATDQNIIIYRNTYIPEIRWVNSHY